MIEATYEFEHGTARLMNKGVILWNGDLDSISAENPMQTFDSLVYALIGADDVWSAGYDLKGIRLTIEIEEAAEQ